MDKLEHMRIQIDSATDHRMKTLDAKMDKTTADLKLRVEEGSTKVDNLAARVERLERGEGSTPTATRAPTTASSGSWKADHLVL